MITGAAHRIGKVIAQTLHELGVNIIIHYNTSEQKALQLCDELNLIRAESAITIQADLLVHDYAWLQTVLKRWDRLDILVNSASAFYTTSIGETTETQWDNLLGCNLKASFFLIQNTMHWLKESVGSVINITDIHGNQPLKNYTAYCVSKAGLVMLTKSMALELAPYVRVNGIAPGIALLPDDRRIYQDPKYQAYISNIPLQKVGTPADIARTVVFLANEPYITGEIIHVDGGLGLGRR